MLGVIDEEYILPFTIHGVVNSNADRGSGCGGTLSARFADRDRSRIIARSKVCGEREDQFGTIDSSRVIGSIEGHGEIIGIAGLGCEWQTYFGISVADHADRT